MPNPRTGTCPRVTSNCSGALAAPGLLAGPVDQKAAELVWCAQRGSKKKKTWAVGFGRLAC
eukprot:7488322-Karenia_brevis.AAC.1